ncbi:MAG: rhomboid family intramembrane serine protease [Acidobacteriota bacterium]|nr:rhomboid family intramembrane serine protease [Acidobacteriota bacterium]
MNEIERQLRQWRNQLKRGLENFKNKSGGSTGAGKRPDIKMCPVCRAFNPSNASVCTYCDAKLGAKPKGDFDAHGKPRSEPMNPVFIVFFICAAMHALAIFFSSRVEDYELTAHLWSPQSEVLIRMGANFLPFIVNYGEVWRMITYTFLHGNLMHIFFNISALGWLGPTIFEAYGVRRFWVITFVTSLGGGLLSAMGGFIGIGGFGVGFSGALFGFIGAIYVWAKKNHNSIIAETMWRYMVWGNIIFIALTVTRFFPVDNLAHLGGMFAGMGLAWLFESNLFRRLGPPLESAILTGCLLLWAFGLFRIFSNIGAITQPVWI